MVHSFETQIAEKYGILEAILLHSIYYWIKKNIANGVHYYDDNWWTYNSAKAFSEYFPYASEGQIRRALDHLRDENVIVTGHYDEDKTKRRLWYALTEKGYAEFRDESFTDDKCICQIQQMHSANSEDAFLAGDESSIYKINNKDMSNKDESPARFKKPTIDEIRAYCRERNNNVDPERFFDYYESKGWKVGKAPMKDWRASVRTWERGDKQESGGTNDGQRKMMYSTNEYDEMFERNLERSKRRTLRGGAENFND